jgi:hypothetical protein
MSSQIFFQCSHDLCKCTEALSLEEFRQLGFPLCPVHKTPMVSQQKDADVTQAVGEILSGVTRLAAAALTQKKRKGAPHAPNPD